MRLYKTPLRETEKLLCLSCLKIGDEVAIYEPSYFSNNIFKIAEISDTTSNGGFILNNGIRVYSDGRTEDENRFYIIPINEEIQLYLWRKDSISKIKKELRIDKLSDDDLKILLNMIN